MIGPQQPAHPSKQLTQQLDLDFVIQAAALGVWELDPTTNQVRWNDRCRELFGLAKGSDLAYEQAIQYIHPDDVKRVDQALQWAMNPDSGGVYDQTCRTPGIDDGQLRWVRFQGRAYFDEAGQVVRFTGIAQELTQPVEDQQQEATARQQQAAALQQAQRQQQIYAAITASIPDLVYVFDLSYRFTYANQALLDMWGSSWEQSIGKGLLENGYEPWHAQLHEREIDQVVATRQAIRGEVAFPHATLGTRIYDYVFAPVFNERGKVEAVAGTTRDITDLRQAQAHQEESQRQLLGLFEQSPVGLATLRADDQLVFEWANSFYGELVARPPQALIGKPLLEALPEIKGQGFDDLLKEVIATGTPFIAPEVAVNIHRKGQLMTIYVDLAYQPQKGTQGDVQGILVVATDVTQQVMSRRKVEESEAKLRAIIDHARAAIGVYVGREMVIENPNQTFIDILGKGPDIAGRPLREVLPELESEGQPFLAILDEVFTSGIGYSTAETLIKIFRHGALTNNYYNFSYTPVLNSEGRTYQIVVVAIEVTDQVLARQKIEESDRFSRTVFYNSPVAKLVFVGPDMLLREANEKMLDLLGRDASIIGQPILESIPEFSRTPLVDQYRQVLAAGELQVAVAQHFELVKNGQSYGGYYDYTYKPLSDASGQLYGVICTMIEVTQQVVAQQKLEEAESALRGAVELAQLGTWSIDVATGGLTYSDRLIEWFGYDPAAQGYNQVIPILSVEDQERVAAAVARALRPDSEGIYEETYTVIHPRTGKKRVLHAHGKTVFDASGQAIRLNGTAQDITLQRELQTALEQEVQQRTQELAATNEELAATNEELEASNEEYAALNEELEEANRLLMRSNDNLQTFAYVASHDLQEPLRKIQQFGDLLKDRYMNSVGEELIYVERMQTAASRMSTLIRDLLNYSRIATQQDTHGPVDLNKVVDRVLATLDLSIQEMGAQINVEPLPTVLGDASQLEQLVQNLLSNALKFSRVDRQGTPAIPRISITAQRVSGPELPPSVKPSRLAPAYEQISVTDNGVGFEEKYLDRIFQVFQRLHGKSQFAGTGVGLAIAQRVVENHGGAITAHSQPEQGATFQVYLPV